MEHYKKGPGGKLVRKTLDQTDWDVLTLLFGFECRNDTKKFAYQQQAKSDCRQQNIDYSDEELGCHETFTQR